MYALFVFIGCVFAKASYPAIPSDLTTPVQQRIAIDGVNCEYYSILALAKLFGSIET